MDGLQFIPGFRFNNSTKPNHRVSRQFWWKNGYALPKDRSIGIGNEPLDVDSTKYNEPTGNGKTFDPTLTYGKVKQPPQPVVLPQFVTLDRKCLSFKAYTIQDDKSESSLYKSRVRRVTITYFLVDDTISIVEPATKDADYVQGCFLKRGPIPNPFRKNRIWHWSDLNVGAELSLYGVTYTLCSCDAFTKHYLASHGVKLGADVKVPDDPYATHRRIQRQQELYQPRDIKSEREVAEAAFKHKKFHEYDGQVLRFYTAWYDDSFEPAQWKYFVFLYFMVDDQVEIHESTDPDLAKCGGDLHSTTFLGRMKLPVERSNFQQPGSMEKEIYYQPKDFIIGSTLFILGRRFLLYDCDAFTRRFYIRRLRYVQPKAIRIVDAELSGPPVQEKVIPPHTGIGDPDDTRQNCLSLTPKPPKNHNFVTYVLNASKKLRYKLKMVPVYEVDKLRDFIMEYCLGNDQMSVTEVAGKNNGFLGGRFMASTRLRKPGTKVDDNLFYGPEDFALGAELTIRGLKFVIVEVDLWTYNYMLDHKYKFSQESIDGAKLFLESKGLLSPS